MKEIKINVYEFDELSTRSKETAMNEAVKYIAENTDFEKLNHKNKLYKAYKKSMEMETPWFLNQYIYDDCKDLVEAELKKYLYTEAGEIFDVIHEKENEYQYIIVPRNNYSSDVIKAKSAEEALVTFATEMDTDMSIYFRAVMV